MLLKYHYLKEQRRIKNTIDKEGLQCWVPSSTMVLECTSSSEAQHSSSVQHSLHSQIIFLYSNPIAESPLS